MQAFPTLTLAAAQVLNLVKVKGVLRGKDLVRELDLPEKDLLDAVRELTQNELLTLSGDCSSLDNLGRSYLTFRPSTSSLAEFAIRSAR